MVKFTRGSQASVPQSAMKKLAGGYTSSSASQQRVRRYLNDGPPSADNPPAKVIPLNAGDYQALPILRKPDKEALLIKHVMDRVKMANEERKRRVSRIMSADVQLSGYINLSVDDKKRKRDNESGRSPKPTDHNLPLAQAQIDESVTYLMSVFAPETDFFEAVAPADKQRLALAVTGEINKQSQKGQYFRQITKFCTNAMRHNIAALTCYWEQYDGVVFEGAPGGAVDKRSDIVWEGNVLHSVDLYNFLYDTTVHPVDLPLHGEFFVEVERQTPFRIKKMAKDGQLFGINRYVNNPMTDTPSFPYHTSPSGIWDTYYILPPSVRDIADINQRPTDFGSILRVEDVKESSPGHELIRYTGWITPADFGLSTSHDMELWRIIIANGKFTTFAKKLDDSHGMLPIVCASPLEDDLRNEQRSYAEQLIPLQHFASFLMNAHQKATRKSIAGVTVYNQQLFPGLDKDTDDLIGAKIPMRSSATGVDIDKAFRHYTDSPDTQQNVPQIGMIVDLMQKFLPTDMLRQVADLERATLYQAAATVQAGNRRQLKNARMISDQALTWLKFQMIYNLYAHKTSIDYIDPNSGERLQISMGEIVAAQIEYDIATGLKGLDRLMQIQILRDAMNMIIQSQQGIAEIDIVKLLNYFMSLAGDRTDLTQFRRVVPPEQVNSNGPANPGQPVNPGLQTPQVPGR